MEGEVFDKQEDRKEDPVRAELLREIATIQIQTYRNNLALGRIEQTLKEIKWKLEQRCEMPGTSTKAPAPIVSSD